MLVWFIEEVHIQSRFPLGHMGTLLTASGVYYEFGQKYLGLLNNK